MPRHRPQVSGYARIAQAEEEEGEQPYSDNDHDDPFQDPPTISVPGTEYAPIQPKRRDFMRGPSFGSASPRRPRRRRTNSGVDVKAINARLERWAEEIKERFTIKRIKGKSAEEETLEIHHSVFVPPEGLRPAHRQSLESDYDDSDLRLSKVEFDDLVESVRTAIELGMHPTLISQGSSGSYFARNSAGKVVGVFKPKDEEPYASKNPKTLKWLHRNLFPFFFGRACLIPNLSYVSEAAAYVLDVQLRTNIVPYTDVVSLSSKSFFYDFWDRRQFRKGNKELPEKQGSFQVFLKGFKGATEFFREHPWPDQNASSFRDVPDHKGRRRKRWDETCRPRSAQALEEEGDGEGDGLMSGGRDANGIRPEFWSEQLQQSFREQLEKLVVLDYIMRNTDRGTDNWMIRIDTEKKEATIVAEYKDRVKSGQENQIDGSADPYHPRNESMAAIAPTDGVSKIAKLGAIDNSLSWPWKHPDAWRSYPFGWLFLPVSLIGRPFTEKTRNHFLPLLTSKEWWSETQIKLRRTFELDADFKERMFARQMAVMKGQAWNVVETLKTPDHGPLELTRRSRVCVWDDLVDIPVAVPLTRPSEEMRRAAAEADQQSRHAAGIEEEEEMDISSAYASAPPSKPTDLLGLMSPAGEARTNPFNHSRQSSSQDAEEQPTSPIANKELLPPTFLSASAPRPTTRRSRTAGRVSLDTPSTIFHSPSERRRRFSFTVGRAFGARANHWGDGDEEDGDLGYAAANDQQNITRKVIVERLEMVKSSFGTLPVEVRRIQQHFQAETEARPDAAIRYENPQHIDRSREAIAKYLNAPVEACVFVPNATTGVNTVLRNLVFRPKDVIVYFATIYGACEKSVSYIRETTPADSCRIQYTYPISDDELCQLFETALREIASSGKKAKVAIFDTIAALPGVRMPFERLTDLCRSHGVLSLIDGAHGIGHIPLDLTTLDPDFFVTNCHKWLFTPRGCAVFYVPLRNQRLMRSSLPTSHGFVPLPQYGEGITNPLPPSGKSDFITNFEFVGTLDDSPYFCVPAALEWRSRVNWQGKQGEAAITAYCFHLARRSGKIVSHILGTEVMENEQGTLGECNFSNVRLPLSPTKLTGGDVAAVAKIGKWIEKTLVTEYQTFIATVYYGGACWVRLSAQVYLAEEDFEWAGHVLAEVCKRVERVEWQDQSPKPKL